MPMLISANKTHIQITFEKNNLCLDRKHQQATLKNRRIFFDF